MRYLLDTNAYIALLNNISPVLAARVRRRRPSDIGVPAPVAYELYYGAFKSQRVQHNMNLLDQVPFEVLPFDKADARCAGQIRNELESVGSPIGPYDLLIAGQARSRKLTLITANSKEFERVSMLKTEDWTV